jgi:hypothetical protein
MRWEAANNVTASLALSMGEDGSVTPVGGTLTNCKIIIGRDSGQIAPVSQSGDYYEIYDSAVGQYRSKLDFPYSPFEDKNLIGATVTVGTEVWIIEYIVKKDSTIIHTLGRKIN